jgi:hypothetical protein
MERLLAVERTNTDGTSIFGHRGNNFDIKKAMSSRPTPVGDNTDWSPIDRTCRGGRKNQRQFDTIFTFWGNEIAIFCIEIAMDGRHNKFFVRIALV